MAASVPRGRLHPVVKATGFVSFFTDMGSEIIYPILPMFLTSLGATRATIGAIEGMAEGLPSIIKLFSGALADRVKNRKWLVLSGYALSTLFKPLIGLARSSGVVFVLRLIDRMGKGIRTAPRDALVADYAGRETRGLAFGFQRGMDHAGALVGGLIGFVCLAVFKMKMQQAILLSVIPGVVSVAVIVFFVRDRQDRRPVASKAVNPFKDLRQLPADFFIYAMAASCFALGNSSDAFLLLRANGMGVEVAWIPLLWSMLHLVKSATSMWGGGLSDRIGRLPVLVVGWSLYALVYVGFALFGGATAAWLLFAAYGLFFGLTEGAGKAVIADLVPEGLRGTAFGFWGMMEGILLVAASLLTGWLWDVTKAATLPLLLCGALSLLAAIFLGLWGWKGELGRKR